jgi:hypothetical protein
MIMQLVNITGTTCIPPQEYLHADPEDNGIRAHIRPAEGMKEIGNR